MTIAKKVIARSLEELIAREVAPLFRLSHLNRDIIIGLVGDRGSGKSIGGGNIAIRDYGLSCEPIWSNMNLRVNVKVNDDYAGDYGVKGGTVAYAAKPMDKQAFLTLDSQYEGGCLFFDEFNLEYGEARRSTANVNLLTDRAVQQLRKLECALIYTVIDEMYVDVRIRDNTDLFIRCVDTAFKPQNLQAKMKQGVAFEWMLYFMSTKLCGIGKNYGVTKKPFGPVPIVLRDMWGSIDTLERQAAGQTKYSVQPKTLMRMDIEEDAKTTIQKVHYAGFDERMAKFWVKHAGDGDVIEISAADMANDFGVPQKEWHKWAKQLWERVPDVEIRGKGGKRSPTKYLIPNKLLSLV